MTTRIIRGKEPPAKAKTLDAQRKAKPTASGLDQSVLVDAELSKLRYKLKPEVQALRAIIKGVHPGITEQWKLNGPSFSYKDHLVTFNLRDTNRVRLIFHNGAILDDQQGFLTGDYPDRRIADITSMADVTSCREKLEGAIQQWIQLMDEK